MVQHRNGAGYFNLKAWLIEHKLQWLGADLASYLYLAHEDAIILEYGDGSRRRVDCKTRAVSDFREGPITLPTVTTVFVPFA